MNVVCLRKVVFRIDGRSRLRIEQIVNTYHGDSLLRGAFHTLKSAGQLLRDKTTVPTPEATLAEVFSDCVTDGAPVGFAAAHMPTNGKPVLWIQDRLSRRETGRPYIAGLPVGIDLIHVDVSRASDLLWAMEEGLRCDDLGGVIGEIWGDPPALDFTASKRLALRAEAQNIPAWLIRRAGTPHLSAARLRWRVNALPSRNHPYDAQAPGHPLWQAELFRARWQTPGEWVAYPDANGMHFEHGLELRDQPVAHAQHA